MKKLLLAGLIALFANASEIDLLKVATDGKVSGKSYVVAQNEAKNVKAGYMYKPFIKYTYYGKVAYAFLSEKKNNNIYIIFARKLKNSTHISVWINSYNLKTGHYGYAYDLYSRYLLAKYRTQIIRYAR